VEAVRQDAPPVEEADDAPSDLPVGSVSGVVFSTAEATKIARALKTLDPDMKDDKIGQLIGRSTRTAQRYLNGFDPHKAITDEPAIDGELVPR
jgi:hypothetical protein